MGFNENISNFKLRTYILLTSENWENYIRLMCKLLVFFFFLIMNFHKRYTYQLYMMFSKKCKLSWDLSATYSQKNNLYMKLQCKIHMPDILIVLVLIKVIINII